MCGCFWQLPRIPSEKVELIQLKNKIENKRSQNLDKNFKSTIQSYILNEITIDIKQALKQFKQTNKFFYTKSALEKHLFQALQKAKYMERVYNPCYQLVKEWYNGKRSQVYCQGGSEKICNNNNKYTKQVLKFVVELANKVFEAFMELHWFLKLVLENSIDIILKNLFFTADLVANKIIQEKIQNLFSGYQLVKAIIIESIDDQIQKKH